MKTEQLIWNEKAGWKTIKPQALNPQLVLYFGSRTVLESKERFYEIKTRYPDSLLVGCSTSGEIMGEEVFDETIVLTAIEFAKTPINVASLLVQTVKDSDEAGKMLGKQLKKEDLAGIMIISDGAKVNGSELIRGIVSVVGTKIPITGGLAGDAGRFQLTLVGCNAPPEPGKIVAIGFYGSQIKIGHGSVGGWDAFGPERQITRSKSNVLYELDGKPALELYKQYLGEQAAKLPGSVLLFPLMVRPKGQIEHGIVRTILSIDENEQSMTFAGDVPEGFIAQLMRANFERLIEGAEEAAKIANITGKNEDKLAILISCVGRKMVLGQRTADEVEVVHELLGEDVAQIGFYSYGEISPHKTLKNCELHNQTMTITLLAED